MRFIGIIPVRMGSKRFPGKPLTSICGKPMLYHVWGAALMSQMIEPLFIATADKEIIEWCEFIGLKYIITRADCRNGTERCHDVMRQLAMRDPDDIVINVQGDEPMIRPESLDALARAFNDPAVQIASLYFRPSSLAFGSDPNRVKVLVGGNGDAFSFSRTMGTAYLWRLYGQHVGVYAYRRDVLAKLITYAPEGDLEQCAWMRHGYRIRMVEIPYQTMAVDAPKDVARVESAMCPSA